jgi:hypothetical protein
MVCGLSRQMVELTLPEFHVNKDLGRGRFSRVDGTAHTWEDGISIFDGIRDILPGKVFCVIYGIQLLGSRRTDKFLADLIHSLRGGNLKILLTTSGESRSLLSNILRSELLLLNHPALREDNSLWMLGETGLAL